MRTKRQCKYKRADRINTTVDLYKCFNKYQRNRTSVVAMRLSVAPRRQNTNGLGQSDR